MNFNIKRAMDTLADRRPVHSNAESYYVGAQREVFASQKFSNMFRENGTYVLNYCKTVVDTVLDRLEISTVESPNKHAQDILGDVWETNELTIDATEIHRRALVYGECYAIVWPDEEGNTTVTYNSPMTTVMVYNEENPRIKEYAAKVWEETNALGVRTTFLNLYFADRIEKYSRQGDLSFIGGTPGQDFRGLGVVENPFGKIPVFHFRTHRPYGTPEHAAAIGPQDAINKLVNNHMLTVDYQGAPQRYALSSGGNNSEFEDFDENQAARDNINAMKSGPGELWYMNGVTQVGQFAPADPAVFTGPVKEYVNAMASLTSTPLHFFNAATNFGSGEALRNTEAPLTKKIRDRQLSFGETWRELFKFVLLIEGIDQDVQILWGGSESLDVSDAWNIASIKRGLGIPLEIVLEEMGYDREIAKQIAAAAKKEAEENAQAGTTTGSASEGTPGQLAEGMNAHNIAVHLAAQKESAAVADPNKPSN